MFIYLAADALFLLVWLILFARRKDLRQVILFASLVVLPGGFLAYLSTPSYYNPPTFFSIPEGLSIEALLLGFGIGGIGAVLYEEIANKRLRKLKKHSPTVSLRILVPAGVVATILGLYYAAGLNMMVSLPITLVLGTGVITLIRRDLAKPALLSGLYFGLLYFCIFIIWLSMFPTARGWWNLAIYGGHTVLGVPLGEVTFGFSFGAFWGVVYDYCFNYRLVGQGKRKRY